MGPPNSPNPYRVAAPPSLSAPETARAPASRHGELEDGIVLSVILVVGGLGLFVGIASDLHRAFEPGLGIFMMLWAVRAFVRRRKSSRSP